MSKRIISFILLFFSCQIIQGQDKLQLRISLGNGKPFSSSRKLDNTKDDYYVVWDKLNRRTKFQAIGHRILQLPQIGFMLEYKHTRHHTFGIGVMAGRTELSSNFGKLDQKGFISQTNGTTIKKIGVEYTYNLFINKESQHKVIKRLYCSAMLGAFLINHRYNNYEYGNKFIFTTKDQFGHTIDSITNDAYLINLNGMMLSGGLRIGLMNKKNQEKLSLSFLYDQGFIDLWHSSYFFYYNYLNDHMISHMISRGSQFKIYFSMPLTLYRFNKPGKIKNGF